MLLAPVPRPPPLAGGHPCGCRIDGPRPVGRRPEEWPWHRDRVHSPLVAAVVTLALLALVCGVVAAVRDRPPGRVTLGVTGLAALVTLVQSVVAGYDLVQGRRPPELATYVGYLLGIVVVLPLAGAWALAERTRWSGVVVAVGGFTVAVMTARLVLLARGTGA
jgi:hypothetical protein